MKQVKAFIFDLDGTLLDTLQDLYLCCNYALRTHGMPERTLEEVCNFVGNGVKKLMERSVPDGLSNPAFEDAFTTFRQYYLLHSLDNTHPYPGIIEALRELDERGMKLAVVSNKFYKATQELCRHFFNNYIKIAIGEREGIRKKPAPDTVVEAMRQLGVSPDETVYVGDSDVDITTARNCNIPCISVLWGFRTKEFLLEHGATTLVEHPHQLLLIH